MLAIGHVVRRNIRRDELASSVVCGLGALEMDVSLINTGLRSLDTTVLMNKLVMHFM